MTRSRSAIAVGLLVVASLVATLAMPVAAAPAANATATATPPPDAGGSETTAANYSLVELRAGGTHPADAPTSVRMMGDSGAVAIRHYPPGPLSKPWRYLEPGTTVKDDKLSLYTIRLGGAELTEATLRVVFWEPATRVVRGQNGTSRTERYAANQTVQTVTVKLAPGYDLTNVSLISHYDRAVEATMFLEVGGETVGKWRFKHHTIPSSESVGIDSRADAWGYTARNAVLPGGLGIILGLIGARRTLRRTGTGPRLGFLTWAFVIGIAGLILIATAWFDLTLILSRLPWIMGVGLGIVAYGGALQMHGSVRTLEILRPELHDARSIRGSAPGEGVDQELDDAADEDADGLRRMREALYVDERRLPAIRGEEDERLKLPIEGLRPWLARLWADPARLDDSEIRTRWDVSGAADEIIFADPESDEPIEHRPARLVWDPPLFVEPDRDRDRDPLDDDAAGDGDGDGAGDDGGRFGVLERVNWSYVIGVGVSLVAGYVIGSWLGVVPAGIALGLLGVGALSIQARDGQASIDVAPVHLSRALATLVSLQREHADARTIEELEEIAWSERSRSALEAREALGRLNETVSEEINRHSVGLDDPYGDVKEVAERDRARANGDGGADGDD